MSLLRNISAGLRSLLRKKKADGELDEELREFMEMAVQEKMNRGVNRVDAVRAVRLERGSLELNKEVIHSARWESVVETCWRDLCYGLRMLRKNPGFTLIAVLTLALGIGASVTIFAFVDTALIKPMPYQRPSRLVSLFESNKTGPQFHLSYLDYLDWKRSSHSFTSMAVYGQEDDLVTTDQGTGRASGARVSDTFFRTLGVHPILGRDFYDGEDVASQSNTALLSYAAWQKRYGGSQDVLGQTVELNGTVTTIVGVLPKNFSFAPVGPAEFWLNIQTSNGCAKDRSCHNVFGLGRLKDGTSIASASSEIKAIAGQLEKQYPNTNRNRGATVTALSDTVIGDIRPVLLVLLGGSVLLLVIAGVNVASLVTIRSETRKREISVQKALGATPARLVRQFVTQGLLLALPGNLLGLAVAYAAISALPTLIPEDRMANMPYLQAVGINIHVLLFASLVSLLTGILFSVMPMVRVSLSDAGEALSQGGRNIAGTVWRRLGAKFVLAELATAVVLLVSAGLLGKSSYLLLRTDSGFEPDDIAVAGVWAPDANYQAPTKQIELEHTILAKLQSVPGVKSVGISDQLPVGTGDGVTSIGVVGNPVLGNDNEVNDREVSSTYFSAIDARLLRGRYFLETDDASRNPVAIVNETLASRLFPDQDPLGKRITFSQEQLPLEIVGVVSDIKEGPLDMADRPALYVPFDQDPANQFFLIVRASRTPQFLFASILASIHEVDPTVAAYGMTTMQDHIRDSPSAYLHRSAAWLVGAFSAIALVLGAVGLYGVMAYSVGQRTREIGIRMALGADRRAVQGMVLLEGLWLTATGIAIGIVSSFAAGELLGTLLFGVKAWDPPTLGAVSVLLGASALLACYIPSRRAMRIDPMVALRHE